MPVFFDDHGFIATPLADGLRVGGAVEMAAPSTRRRTSPAPPPCARRCAATCRTCPRSGGVEWMGCRPSTPDSLPVIGAHPRDPRIVFAFGHGHLGLTLSAATARHVASSRRPARPTPISRRSASSASSSLRPRYSPAAQSPVSAMRKTFFCIDAHTCGNPVRVVAGGGPPLDGATMSEKRQDFLARLRLDPHRPDVRAARPRRDVRHDPLRADARRHRLPRCSSSRPAAACRCAATAPSARSRCSSRRAW